MVKVVEILDRLDILHRHSNEGQKVKMTVWPSLFRNQRYYVLDASRLLCEHDLTYLMAGAGEFASTASCYVQDLGGIPRL